MIHRKIVAFVILFGILLWIFFGSSSSSSPTDSSSCPSCDVQTCPSCDSSSGSCPSCPSLTCPSCNPSSTESCPSCVVKTCPSCEHCETCPDCSSSITNICDNGIIRAGCEFRNISGAQIAKDFTFLCFPTQVYSVGSGITIGGPNNTWFQNTSGTTQYWFVGYNAMITGAIYSTTMSFICKNKDTTTNTTRYGNVWTQNYSTMPDSVGMSSSAIIEVENDDYIMIQVFIGINGGIKCFYQTTKIGRPTKSSNFPKKMIFSEPFL